MARNAVRSWNALNSAIRRAVHAAVVRQYARHTLICTLYVHIHTYIMYVHVHMHNYATLSLVYHLRSLVLYNWYFDVCIYFSPNITKWKGKGGMSKSQGTSQEDAIANREIRESILKEPYIKRLYCVYTIKDNGAMLGKVQLNEQHARDHIRHCLNSMRKFGTYVDLKEVTSS